MIGAEKLLNGEDIVRVKIMVRKNGRLWVTRLIKYGKTKDVQKSTFLARF